MKKTKLIVGEDYLRLHPVSSVMYLALMVACVLVIQYINVHWL